MSEREEILGFFMDTIGEEAKSSIMAYASQGLGLA